MKAWINEWKIRLSVIFKIIRFGFIPLSAKQKRDIELIIAGTHHAKKYPVKEVDNAQP